MKYLSNHALSQPITYAEVRELRRSELNAARQYDDIGLDVLLTQAGYYTIREVTEDGYALLGYIPTGKLPAQWLNSMPMS